MLRCLYQNKGYRPETDDLSLKFKLAFRTKIYLGRIQASTKFKWNRECNMHLLYVSSDGDLM